MAASLFVLPGPLGIWSASCDRFRLGLGGEAQNKRYEEEQETGTLKVRRVHEFVTGADSK